MFTDVYFTESLVALSLHSRFLVSETYRFFEDFLQMKNFYTLTKMHRRIDFDLMLELMRMTASMDHFKRERRGYLFQLCAGSFDLVVLRHKTHL